MSEHNEADSQASDSSENRTSEAPLKRRMLLPRFAFLIVVIIVVAAVAFVGEALGRPSTSTGPSITVTGSGAVSGRPNTMSFQVGVSTQATSAATALSQNNVQMKKVETDLLSNGVTKKNLQTSDLEIYQTTNNRGVVTGFNVSDELNVTTHNMAHAGEILDGAASTAGNDVELSGVTFSISNQSALLARARARAVANADIEATDIAKGAHTSVGSVLRVYDEENSTPTGIILPEATAYSSAAGSVPVQAGSESVSVQVKVVYSLKS